MSKYGEQLKHPNWQRKRLQRLNAAGWKCTDCDATESELHVHHERYISGHMPWEYEDADLVVLCHECHGARHGKGERRRRVARMPAVAAAVSLLDRALWILMQRSDLWAKLEPEFGFVLATMQTDQTVIARLVDLQHPDPSLDLGRELERVIDRLRLHRVEEEMAALFRATELSDDSKHRGAYLMAEQARLKLRLSTR